MHPKTNADFPHPELAAQLREQAAKDSGERIEDTLAADPQRLEDFSCSAAGWHLDYARHRLSRESRSLPRFTRRSTDSTRPSPPAPSVWPSARSAFSTVS